MNTSSASLLCCCLVLSLGLAVGCAEDATRGSADVVATADSAATTDADAGPDGLDVSHIVTGEAACESIAAAACAPVDGCCGGVGPHGGSAECRATLVGICASAGAAELAAVAAGDAVVAQDALAACLGAYADVAGMCRQPDAEAHSRHCAGVYVDVAAVGDECVSGLGGLRCAGGDGLCFPEPSGTRCRAWATPGQPCADAPCPPWLICMPGDGDALVCDAPRDIDGRCTADVHCRPEHRCDGGVCAPGLSEGASCTRWFDCGAGLTCEPLEERCRPGADQGHACVTQTQCAEGLRCGHLLMGVVCVPGEPTDGSDDPGLPGLFEPCTGECQVGLTCAEGPLPGACAPDVCAVVAP